jgi:hypothetical protein
MSEYRSQEIQLRAGLDLAEPFDYLMVRDSSVGIAGGYELDARGVGVRVSVGARIFSSASRPDRL